MPLPVLVINRDQDTERLARFAASAESFGIAYERMPAFDAHNPDFPFRDHADLIGDHFWGEPDTKPGAVGCFLSHRAAWQHAAESGAPWTMICEDDAVFFKSPDRLQSLIQDSPRNDILFANQRLASWAASVSHSPVAGLEQVVTGLAAKGGPKPNGLKPSPGADCYVLSAPAAQSLLALTAGQRIVCGVDWAMLWNGLPHVTDNVASAFPELGILRKHMDIAVDPLSIAILTDPVADQGGKGGSTIRHSITRPIAELRGG